MIDGRRAFLAGFVAMAAGRLWAAQQEGIPGAPNENPSGPLTPSLRSQRFPAAADDGEAAPSIDPHAVLKQNQKEIKKDMTELESLVGDLRKQVDTIDSANVLSLDLVHKAEQIEKLAHQIKTLARGA
ncbi:MAG TPA: hypothetical protein VEH50_01170 [Methylomirabilota bacterium]|jgi:hypothetical protein|nr:hypothetical protein [Methylomirabilota bacterium]